MKPGQTIVIQLCDFQEQPLRCSNVYVNVSFYMHGQYRYGFRFGPTDDEGTLRIEYRHVERERTEDAKECVMDYNTPLTECDDRVEILIPTAKELRKASEVATRWAGRGITPEYAKGWLTAENARIKAGNVFAELMTSETIVPIPCRLV